MQNNCVECIHAHRVEDEDGHYYECDAEVYDTVHLTCFIPRTEE